MPQTARLCVDGTRLELGRSRSLKPAEQQEWGEDRRAAIARVLPVWPHELEDTSHSARLRIVAKLRRALRAERGRGVSGHWTYDLARHVQLLRVYRQELAALRSAAATAAGEADHRDQPQATRSE
jgi:hypothetical protein